MTTLSPEQRQEILRAGEEPVRLADPETQTEYVLLKADLFDHFRTLLDDARSASPPCKSNSSPCLRDEAPVVCDLGLAGWHAARA